MTLKRFTMIMGVLFLGIGILGFFPGLVTHPADAMLKPVDVTHSHGLLFGLFPVNLVHNLIHIAFGIWALYAASDVARSRLFCRANMWIYGTLAILGLIPATNTMFGLVPIHGHDVWLHAGIAAATGYFGYVWNVSGEHTGRPMSGRPSTAGGSL